MDEINLRGTAGGELEVSRPDSDGECEFAIEHGDRFASAYVGEADRRKLIAFLQEHTPGALRIVLTPEAEQRALEELALPAVKARHRAAFRRALVVAFEAVGLEVSP